MDQQTLQSRIAGLLVSRGELPEAVAHDVAFHLTDWLDDFERLDSLFREHSEVSDEEAYRILMQFLIHVPNHLAAASKLWLEIPVTDIFGVGATTDDDPDDA